MVNIREIAEADLSFTLEDNIGGFGWAINVTDPSGKSEDLYGQSNDIAAEIDPETGQLVSGRAASVALRISSLISKGLGIPEGISDESKKPWIIKFKDINGNNHTFKVQASNPDRGMGVVTCLLETYQES